MFKSKKNIFIFFLILVLSFGLFACKDDKTPEIADNTKFYDTVTKKLTLNKSYEGKSFLNDGIGKAVVNAYTDGDTVRFRLSQGDIVIIRFYEIDTPESTSNIEKWGKAASNFTKTKLSQATEIVLEATADKAVHDSYGTRYLGYVWYKTADYPTFKNLNLELVENGFTEDKGINTSDYPYYSYFHEANKFAQSIKLRWYSDLDDPLYTTDPVLMTLKEFEDNRELYYNSDVDAGAKVRLYACITDLIVSQSGTYTFVATEIDPNTFESYSINVYAGYVSSTASDMKIGHMYEIVGNVAKYNGVFQISGVQYNSMYDKPEFTKVTQKDYHLTFNSSMNFISQYSQTLYTDLTVVRAEVEDGVLSINGIAQLRTKNGVKEEVKTFNIEVNVPESYVCNIGEGAKISLAGYQFVLNSGIINLQNYTDIIIR